MEVKSLSLEENKQELQTMVQMIDCTLVSMSRLRYVKGTKQLLISN